MKKYLSLALCLALVTPLFCAERPLLFQPIHENPKTPEDRAENFTWRFLYELNHSTDSDFSTFIKTSISYAKEDIDAINNPFLGSKDFRYFFVTPSNKTRMTELERHLRKCIASSLVDKDGAAFEALLLLEDALDEKEDDEFYDYGMHFPCTIL